MKWVPSSLDSHQVWDILHSLLKKKKDEANGSDVRQDLF